MPAQSPRFPVCRTPYPRLQELIGSFSTRLRLMHQMNETAAESLLVLLSVLFKSFNELFLFERLGEPPRLYSRGYF